MPHRARRRTVPPDRHASGRARASFKRRIATVAARLALTGAMLGGAACGGSSDTPAASPSAPTAVPSPHITAGAPPAGAVDVVRGFWKAVGEGRLSEAQRFLTSPDSSIREWTDSGVGKARVVSVVADSVGPSPGPDATIQFAVDVWIKPASALTPWGATGTHTLFERVVRMSDGSWRLVESGTGP